jgi:hypothetical protein
LGEPASHVRGRLEENIKNVKERGDVVVAIPLQIERFDETFAGFVAVQGPAVA